MNVLLNKIRSAWDFRRDEVHRQGLSAFRLINGAADGFPHLVVEVYGENLFILMKDPVWQERMTDLEKALKAWGKELGRGDGIRIFVAANFSGEEFHYLSEGIVRTAVSEGEHRFEIHLGESQHPGLFLDQRVNRRRVGPWANGKSLLNLFCHTGAFTVVALKSGAKEVHSVDLSTSYLEWLRRNLELNGLGSAHAPVFAQDVFAFLKSCKPFDRIIVDPPTFSRGKKGAFSTEKDLEPLLTAAAERLAPAGEIFLSINTQKIGIQEFKTRVKEAIRPFALKILEHYPLPFDFRLTEEEKKNPYLKSCLIG